MRPLFLKIEKSKVDRHIVVSNWLRSRVLDLDFTEKKELDFVYFSLISIVDGQAAGPTGSRAAAIYQENEMFRVLTFDRPKNRSTGILVFSIRFRVLSTQRTNNRDVEGIFKKNRVPDTFARLMLALDTKMLKKALKGMS